MKLLLILACVSLAFGQTPATKQPREQPEFYDEPTFIVSGVTDYTYRGGHGSDAVLRSTEALTAATASLKSQSKSSETPAARQHALAEADEKRGNSLDAVREYQRAAELDPSESNLFDWGLELLTHRAAEPAVEVFTKGSRLSPGSVRMLLGLAVAFYMRGDYDRSAQRFFEASDLNPDDPVPYMFLGRIQTTTITKSHQYLQRLQTFATLQPNNAWANYYYAACLWNQRTNSEDSALTSQVRQLLNHAIRLDPNLGPAYLLLGILYSEQKDLPDAISAFRRASEVSSDMEEAHYRLSQAYELSGERAKAHEELELYKQLSNNSTQKAKRERKELQQFVFTLRDGNSNH
jgi:tetratricopeptide (TPR) repeat protein